MKKAGSDDTTATVVELPGKAIPTKVRKHRTKRRATVLAFPDKKEASTETVVRSLQAVLAVAQAGELDAIVLNWIEAGGATNTCAYARDFETALTVLGLAQITALEMRASAMRMANVVQS